MQEDDLDESAQEGCEFMEFLFNKILANTAELAYAQSKVENLKLLYSAVHQVCDAETRQFIAIRHLELIRQSESLKSRHHETL